MSNEQRSLRAFGRTSSSLFSASTEGGSYVLKQAFTFAADGSLSNVALGESVPVAQGAVETVVAAPRTEVEHRADGSRVVTATGLASPVASVNDGLVAARTLTVVAVLAPDLVSVLSEQVLVAPVASSDVPPVTATTPTPDPAPGLPGAPTAPPSPAGQLPSPLAGAEPALRAEAKIPAQADVPR